MALFPIIPSFAGGEASESLWARIDLERYNTFLRRARNVIIMPQGGVINRPGTFYAGNAKYFGSQARLIPFQFSTTQAYALEFGHLYMRIYMIIDNVAGVVMKGEVPVEVATPYRADDLSLLRYVQSADTLYLLHPDYSPRTLTRTSHVDWTLSTMVFDPPPMGPMNTDDDNGITLNAISGATGKRGESVYIHSQKATFDPKDVGRWLRLDYTRYSQTVAVGNYTNSTGNPWYSDTSSPAWKIDTGYYRNALVSNVVGGVTYYYMCNQPHTSAADSEPGEGVSWAAYWLLVESGGSGGWEVSGEWEFSGKFATTDTGKNPFRLQESTDSGASWHDYAVMEDGLSHVITGSAPVFDDGTRVRLRLVSVDGPTYKMSYSLRLVEGQEHGLLSISQYVSPTQVKALVKRDALVVTDGRKVLSWYLEAFGGNSGYPSVGAFFQDRLVLAATPEQPQAFWMSETGDYNAFDWGEPLEDSDTVNHAIPGRAVNGIVGMVSLESMVFLTTGGEWRIAPSSDNKAISPSSILVRAQGERGASGLCPLVVGNVIMYIQRYQTRVRGIAYSLDADAYDGPDLSIIARHLLDGHTIVDWALQSEPWGVVWAVRDDGKLLSLTYLKEHEVVAWALHETDGQFESICSIPGDCQDEVFFAVRREVNGGYRRYVERLAHRWNGAPGADSGQFLDCSLRYSPSVSFAHLEGKEVSVLSNGFVYDGRLVSKGVLDISGIDDPNGALVGLPYPSYIRTMEMEIQGRTGTSMGRRKRISGVKVKVKDSTNLKVGPDLDRLSDLKSTSPSPVIDVDPPQLFTGYAYQAVRGGFGDEGSVVLYQDSPYPMEILAVLPVIDNES